TEVERANPATSGPNADPDGDGWSNLFEFGLGSNATNITSLPPAIQAGTERIANQDYFVLSFTRTAGKRGGQFSAEVSDDLNTWNGGGVPMTNTINPDGSITGRFRLPAPIENGSRFMRLRITQ
ncbi:MAG: hypothetical protein QNK80_00005, partial [Akkermansiaceae bacterium]